MASLLSDLLTFVEKHPGIIVVLIAVAGEVALDWNETSGKRARLKKFFMALLVLGLAYELVEASRTDKDAANAIERAALIESNSVSLSKKIEELRLENNTQAKRLAEYIAKIEYLEKVGFPRIYKPDSKNVDWLKMFAGTKFKIVKNDDPAQESEQLYRHILRVLSEAHWVFIPSKNGEQKTLFGAGVTIVSTLGINSALAVKALHDETTLHEAEKADMAATALVDSLVTNNIISKKIVLRFVPPSDIVFINIGKKPDFFEFTDHNLTNWLY